MSTPRVATAADTGRIATLIRESARGLSEGFYTAAQVESAIRFIFGVDSQLIADGTYYVIEIGDRMAAAGGWSGRRSLFGGDQTEKDDDGRLDPRTEPARIRAFFVHPDFARRGLARRLYEACERAARSAGFTRFELMGTLPGVPLYTALGFTSDEPFDIPMPDGTTLPCIRMSRAIGTPQPSRT